MKIEFDLNNMNDVVLQQELDYWKIRHKIEGDYGDVMLFIINYYGEGLRVKCQT